MSLMIQDARKPWVFHLVKFFCPFYNVCLKASLCHCYFLERKVNAHDDTTIETTAQEKVHSRSNQIPHKRELFWRGWVDQKKICKHTKTSLTSLFQTKFEVWRQKGVFRKPNARPAEPPSHVIHRRLFVAFQPRIEAEFPQLFFSLQVWKQSQSVYKLSSGLKYRYLPPKPNMDNPNSQTIWSRKEVTLLSLITFVSICCWIRNSVDSKVFAWWIYCLFGLNKSSPFQFTKGHSRVLSEQCAIYIQVSKHTFQPFRTCPAIRPCWIKHLHAAKALVFEPNFLFTWSLPVTFPQIVVNLSSCLS